MKNHLQWAGRLIRRFARRRILVVGDLMLDRYIHGTVSRISPEAPVPVVLVGRERNVPGGAANVARNVRTLGGRVVLGGILGRDEPGRMLLEVLRAEDVDTAGVLCDGQWRTTLKTRVLAERQQVVRIDWERDCEPGAGCRARLRRRVAELVAEVDGVVVEDYGKGAVSQNLMDALLRAARARGVPVALDPKDNFDLDVRGITVATPNRREAFVLARMPERPPAEKPLQDRHLLRAGDILMEQWQPAMLVITLGTQGLLLMNGQQPPLHIPTVAREVFDVSGAGDTVIAAILLALAAGADYVQAAELANCAAGVVVGKVGTAGCTAQELIKFLDVLMTSGPGMPAGKGRR